MRAIAGLGQAPPLYLQGGSALTGGAGVCLVQIEPGPARAGPDWLQNFSSM